MKYAGVSITFSDPDAAQYFLVKANEANFVSATDALILYYDLKNMENFDGSELPLTLIFKKDSNLEDEKDYAVTKILVNDASSFNESNLGINVQTYGRQSAQSSYYAGKYVTYNDEIYGSVNFTDFKIQSIQNTQMQIVFFVKSLGGVTINLIAESYSNQYINFSCFINEGSGIQIVKTGDILTFKTTAVFIPQNNWEFDTDYPLEQRYHFEYGVTKNDVLKITNMPENPTQTGTVIWQLKISEIIWDASDKTITVGPISYNAYLRRQTDEYRVSVTGRAKYRLNSNNEWEWTSESVSGTYIVFHDDNIPDVYDEELDMRVPIYRAKSYSAGPALDWGIQLSNNDEKTPIIEKIYVSEHR